MSQFSKDAARAYLKTVAGKHLPKTARSYSFMAYTGDATHNALGLSADLRPQEGKVVEVSEEWVVLKKGRASEFFVAARHLLNLIPEVGATVVITPYARRGFDGKRIDEPKVTDQGNGYVIRSMIIGESRSPLPIDKESLSCPELLTMISQIEEMESPDGVRRLSQILVDAGAYKAPVSYKDPKPSDIISVPPTLRFRVESAKHTGYVDIIYNRGADYYDVHLIEDISLNVLKEYENIDTFSLGELLLDAIDDGQWKLATVEVLKAAPKLKTAA